MLPRLRDILLLIFAGLVSSGWAAPVYEVVADFVQPGRQPLSRLLYVPTDGNLYGTTSAGGAYDLGTVFRLTPTGQVTTLVSFSGIGGPTRGESPVGGLVIGPDGALYGTTQGGGAGDYGTAFRITTAGVFATLTEFTGTGGVARGAVPHELIYSSSDGFFYGVTEAGGAIDLGTVFRMGTNGLVTSLVDFTGTTGIRKGASPVGALVQNGQVLFGVTQTGGAADFGTVYSVTTNGTWNLLAEFTGVTGTRRGSFPSSGLVFLADGALYGTTSNGGVSDEGTVYRLTLGGSYTLIRDFSGPDGAQPDGGLVAAPDGSIFGTTASGGADDLGTIFKLVTPDGTNWVHSVVSEFSGEGGVAPGASPQAALCVGANGLIFGTTSAGGVGGFGTAFSVSSSGLFSSVANFTTPLGWRPSGGVVPDLTGEMLAPNYNGGASGYGTLVRVGISGGLSTVAAFGQPLGLNPEGTLLRLGQDFFGVTRNGGANLRGTVFRQTTGFGTSLISSFNTPGGARPEGPLTLGPGGYFFAVAREGGTNSRGAIVRVATDGTKVLLASFTGITGTARGQTPRAPLALGADGKLYGVTERGGSNDQGTIFSLAIDGTITVLQDFTPTGPKTPLGGLVTGVDGAFYGTTSAGGAGGAGTVFRYAAPGGFSVVADFTGPDGAFPGSRPAGPLHIALDGTIYGTCTQGAENGFGCVFRIPPGASPGKLAAFSGVIGGARGSGAIGSLLLAPDGLLYGTTAYGGSGGGGTIFRMRQIGPHVSTDPPAFAPGSVVFRGTVQTGGEQVDGSFEYGSTPALGTIVQANVGSGPSPVTIAAPLSGPLVGATVYYRARAINPSGTSLGVIRNFVVPTPFDAWRLQVFGSTNIAATGDNDGDGLSNLGEYALLGGPTISDPEKSPRPVITNYPEGRRLSIIVPRDPARSDITVRVDAADQANGPWAALATSSAGNPFSGPGYVGGDAPTAGVKMVEIRDVVNVSDASRRFVRVYVSLP